MISTTLNYKGGFKAAFAKTFKQQLPGTIVLIFLAVFASVFSAASIIVSNVRMQLIINMILLMTVYYLLTIFVLSVLFSAFFWQCRCLRKFTAKEPVTPSLLYR